MPKLIEDIDKYDDQRIINAMKYQCPVCDASSGQPCIGTGSSAHLYREKIETNNTRLSKDQYWINILEGIASRATCPRRQSSAIIVDDDNHLLASGYNGSPKGMVHCTDFPCEGVNDKSGDSSRCIAVHAEQNAIIQAGDRLRFASKMYSLTFPCFVCAKLICQTPIKTVIFVNEYPDPRSHSLLDKAAIRMVKK